MKAPTSRRATVAALPHGTGRGPGGKAHGILLPAGRCAVPGCGATIDPTRLMCRRDWYLVPRQQRDRLWAAWSSGAGVTSQEYRQAVPDAIDKCRAVRLDTAASD